MNKIRLERGDRAYTITLADPPLNILDIEMLSELRSALASVRNDRHALVIRADGGRAFSAGASVQDHIGESLPVMLTTFHDCFRTLESLDLITVAAVNGAALGGGCELALGCDFVVAGDRARFGQPEIRLGVFPPVAAWQLSRQVPPRRGLELLLGGETVTAAEALTLGMVNTVVPSEEFDGELERWMEKFYTQSASSLRMAKRAFRLASGDELSAKLDSVERLYMDELMATSDANEGLAAFVEKRSPVWKGC